MTGTKKSKLANKFIDSVMEDLRETSSTESPSIAEQKDADFLNDLVLSEPSGPEGSILNLVPESKAVVVTKSKPVIEESATLQLANIVEDKTASLNSAVTSDRTQPMVPRRSSSPALKINYGGSPKSSGSPRLQFGASAGQVSEAQLAQAETLHMAQNRLVDLEKEIERLRVENELLVSAGAIARNRIDEITEMLHEAERSKTDALEQSQIELKMARESLVEKERELLRVRKKVEELESRLSSDLKKIRVRERELENRLELSRLEKTALVRSKDDTILDLKRRLDQNQSETETYKQKASELQAKIDNQQDQMARTVRALRLALVNLDQSDLNSVASPVPLKKAE
jgi:DNA repair exonuclease SbcCD ATPase subunit